MLRKGYDPSTKKHLFCLPSFPKPPCLLLKTTAQYPSLGATGKYVTRPTIRPTGQPGLKVELNANVFPVVRVLCFWQLLLFRQATFFVSSSILHSEQFRRYRSSFKCLNWSCFHISLRRSRQVMNFLSLVPSRPRRFRM